MFTTQDYSDLSRLEFYALLVQQARAMFRFEELVTCGSAGNSKTVISIFKGSGVLGAR
jgi:hypothetical protein